MPNSPIKSEVHRLVRQQPFRPFVLTLENGDDAQIEHPENIAFDPADDAPESRASEFYVITQGVRIFSTFDAVTSIEMRDEPSEASP